MTGREETNKKIRYALEKKTEQNPILHGFFIDMDSSGLEIKTSQNYINMTLRFLTDVGKPVNDITVNDVNEFLASHKKGDKPQTHLRTVWYCLNRFFDYLVRTGEASTNIMERVKKPKAKPAREVNRTYLTPDEYKLLLDRVDEEVSIWTRTRDKAILRLFIETGIRCSALSEINVSDIFLDDLTIRVTDKENKTTMFPISEGMKETLRIWIAVRSCTKELDANEPALFLSVHNKRISTDAIRDIVDKYSKVIKGKHITPHKLRASFATNLYNQTGDIRLVQECMNHADISTTQLYVQSDGRNRKKAANIISKLIKREE